MITFFTGAAFPVFLLNAFAKNEKANLTITTTYMTKDLGGPQMKNEKHKESAKGDSENQCLFMSPKTWT